MTRHIVCKTSDLAPGECMKVKIDGRDIAIYNVEGTFYATDDFCRHRGGHLGEGFLTGNTVTCPEHGWRYDVTSGRCLSHPQGDVKGYSITIENDVVRIDLPDDGI